MYIFAVALEDGCWHHIESYRKERANRESTIVLWHKIKTWEDPEWTQRYHCADPELRAFGGKAEIFLRDGTRIVDEMDVANAHPRGAKPFRRSDYEQKLRILSEGIVAEKEIRSFLDDVHALPDLPPSQLRRLNVVLDRGALAQGKRGLFS
jgi:2-methylcitrate dehydratase